MTANSATLRTKQNSRQTRERVALTVRYVIMVVLAVVLLFPFLYMVSKSLMTSEEVVDPTIKFFPSVPQFYNYVELFTVKNEGTTGYLMGTVHTLLVVGFNIVAISISASLIAFSFAKLQWIGRNVMFALMLGTMMLPAVVTQLPLYVIYTKMGWIDTLLPFTIPNLFGGGAIYIFLIRQFMRGIPRELENAAKIDGANVWQIFWRIMIPLCMPIITFIMVNTFIGVWNDFMGPLIYLQGNPDQYTLAVGIYYKFMGGLAQENFPNQQMAVGVLMSIPPAILFFIFQKQLIEGVTMSGLKG